ncbi:dihydrodipicolinate synthase family protein [Catellatospora vulcania]|uniref:dihydrodipicolinate synthase family protein n=1 Tax=Catellatospora vulcania TaxID=1460450 RepID=UPI0012D3B238|nr:dihydrodipicolinate synthase family protein [Catellatospora vulcania]
MTLHGLYIPLITPFGADGAVALDALERLAHQVLDDGATGLVALGTTGEPGSLTEPEKQSVIETVARVSRERSAPLIVGAATAEALAALAAVPEAVAALTVVPPFVRPGEAGVLAHFARLAEASPVPIVVYDIPYRTGQYLTAGALRGLAAIGNVAGVKYAGGGINEDTVAMMADPRFAVLGGDDTFISPLLALGAHGGILSSAHLATAQFAELIRLWQAGDATRARALGHRLAPLSKALFAEPNPTVVKSALHAQGRIPTPGVRLPLLNAHPDNTATALKHLAELG